jgi:dihydrofolate reductase
MTINLIACVDLNNSIGYKGSLLTKPPLDFQHFKNLTIGKHCVMGKSTYDEIGKPLPKRYNLVLTRKINHDLPSDVFVYHSVPDIIHEYENYAEKEIELFVCGGEKVYKEFLPHADYIHLTIVDHKFPKSDRHFPKFDLSEWEVVSNIKNAADENYPYDYYFVTYKGR